MQTNSRECLEHAELYLKRAAEITDGQFDDEDARAIVPSDCTKHLQSLAAAMTWISRSLWWSVRDRDRKTGRPCLGLCSRTTTALALTIAGAAFISLAGDERISFSLSLSVSQRHGSVHEFTDGRCQVVPAYAHGTSEASRGKQDAPPRHGKSGNANHLREFIRGRSKETRMDTTTLLIVILVLLLLFGGGWYGRGRWY